VDIAASLIVLHGKKYTHNDIKTDNIVLCTEAYNLIDWGAATPMEFKKQKHGSLLTTSPLRWFLMGYNMMISASVLGTKTYFKNKAIYKSPLFQETIKRINEEFYELVGSDDSLGKKQALFERFKESMDIFMLGMTALHLIIEQKLDWSKYKSIVERFTSLREPIDAHEALRLASKLSDSIEEKPF